MTIFFVSFTSPSSTGSIVRLIKLRFALNGLAQGRLPRLWLMQKKFVFGRTTLRRTQNLSLLQFGHRSCAALLPRRFPRQ